MPSATRIKSPALTLALETSCDDTAVAILEHRSITEHRVIAASRAGQVATHAPFCGVVPSLAAREHARNVPILVEKVWQEALTKKPSLKSANLAHIAYTVEPGLAPCLLVGQTAAQTLAWSWNLPLKGVHHVMAHIASALAAPELKGNGYPLPAVALVVSGGHTSLFSVPSYTQIELLGQTRDDAAGEAFDKVARIIGLPYPGGPALEQLARKGDPARFNFPRPMLKDNSPDFSFAGLKTAVLYTWRDLKQSERPAARADIAASFQQAVADVLTGKAARAAQSLKAKTIIMAGGVAANETLRLALRDKLGKLSSKPQFVVPPKPLCTDNAVMIGIAGFIDMRLLDQKSSMR